MIRKRTGDRGTEMRRKQAIVAGRCGAALLGAVLVLGGCARTEDPARAGFFSGIANLADGTYERRGAELDRRAADSEAQARYLEQRAAALETERRQLDAEEQALRARTARLDAELAAMRRRLAEARRQQGADQARLAELQARADALRRRQEQVEQAPPDPALTAEIERIERENRELMALIDRMMQGGVT